MIGMECYIRKIEFEVCHMLRSERVRKTRYFYREEDTIVVSGNYCYVSILSILWISCRSSHTPPVRVWYTWIL